MSQNKKAFTLVELLVVVVILGILSTIGFISYSGYQSGVRDANRIAQMKEIQKGLEGIKIRGKLPLPDETRINILLNGELVAYQGYAGEKVLGTLGYSGEGVDPKDGTYFSYYLTKNRKYFQLMAFLEEDPDEISFVGNKLKAIDYSKRLPYSVGDNLGILTDENNNPIQEVKTTQIDIKSDLNTLLKSHFRGTEYVSGTGSKYVEFKKLLKIDKVGGKEWTIENNKFIYRLDPITIVTCGDKSPGDTFNAGEVTYTVVNNQMLADKIGSNDTAFYEKACTTLVTDMNTANAYNGGVFYNATINPDLSHWDTSNVTDMKEMFHEASSFNQPLNWDISKVTDMSYMFYKASSFNQLLNWDTSNVTGMNSMFVLASSFNQPLNWNTSKVTNMAYMFNGASSFNQSLDSFDTSKVTRMNWMFCLASSFNQPLSSFDTSKVTWMANMFRNMDSFNQPLDNFDTSKVTNIEYMFYNTTSFDQNISGWDVSSVTNSSGFDSNTSSSWIASEKPTF